MIITIDGPAGSGKSTISRLLAKTLDFLYLDTGAMYRAVALQATRKDIDFSDGKALKRMCKNLDLEFESEGEINRLFMGPEDVSSAIRTPQMDMLSSRISAQREVREAMTELQMRIGAGGRVVAEGRDMGTVVFPNASYKFFLTATLEERAHRRYRERIDRGEDVSRDAVVIELRKRDQQDTMREIAPLKAAEDGKIIDSTGLNVTQVLQCILDEIDETDISIHHQENSKKKEHEKND